jgi:hypothetical protein
MARSVTLGQVRSRWGWRPIPGCPGRYKLAKTPRSPKEIAGTDALVECHDVPNARDPVWAVRSAGGGIISYEQADGTLATVGPSMPSHR